jgi:3-hexulose-6-phosphate synthase
MNIQLALDRFTIDEAVHIANLAEQSIDWIEVGTSLIKEYGMESVKRIKEAFPDKIIVADMKTIDNARYEFEMCFRAGADVATVMGASPIPTLKTCMKVSEENNKKVMIDLLNTTQQQKEELFQFKDAYFCDHVSKDEQEIAGKVNRTEEKSYDSSLQLAVAGGITLQTISELKHLQPDVWIIGSGITKAEDPAKAAEKFKTLIKQGNGE